MEETLRAINHNIATGNFEAAEEAALYNIRSNPNEVAFHFSLAECLCKQLTFDRAIEQCFHVLHAAGTTPTQALLTVNILSKCGSQLGMPELARPYLDRASSPTSPYASDRCWRPRILREMHQLDEALSEFQNLQTLFPDQPFVTFMAGETMLMMGLEAGRQLSWAYHSRAFVRDWFPDQTQVERMWEGEPLDGKSIVIVPTAGHGDLFENAGHIRQLKQLGARHVTAVAAGPYHQLLISAGVDEVVGWSEIEDVKSRSDTWVGTFGLARADIAGDGSRKPSGYMTPPPSAAADSIAREMRQRAGDRVCIGLYWHSDSYGGETKSIPLHHLTPLLDRQDVHWLILQRGFALRRFQHAGIGRNVTIPEVDLPFDDAGALLHQLDGVATICAWPFHLAGALGIRTWLLAGRVLSPRHLNSERESVLYPDCASLVRQPRVGDWASAIAQLGAELDGFVSARRAEAGRSPENRQGNE